MKIDTKIIAKIEKEAKEFFVGASGCHDWSHVQRVHDLALRIAKKEKADVNIVRIAAYLHDIGRKEEFDSKGKISHVERGAQLADQILSKYNISEEDKNNIKHCIHAHSYRHGIKPETIEAKVIFDSDKLDSIGAIGIGRAFLFSGRLGSNCLYTGREKELVKNAGSYGFTKDDSALLEYYFKLKNIKNKIITKTAKKIAKERHDYMAGFFKRFELEILGKI